MTNNKDKKVLNVPNLRFPEFTEEWERCSLGHVTDFVKERISTDKLTLANYVSTENMKSDFGGINPAISIPNNTNVIHYKKGDVLLSNIRPYLRKVWAANSDGGCSTDVFVFRAKSISPSFLHYIMANDTFINYVMSGAKGVKMPRGDKEQMLKYVFSIPRIEEQYKISRLLHLLDDRIATQNKIIEKYESLIQAIIYQKKMDGIREGNWQKTELSKVLQERTEKNINGYTICSVSVSQGVINQIEYLGRSFAAKETSHYNVVKYGDIVYTKSPTGDFPYGIVKRSYIKNAVAVSPLYGVYKPINDNIGIFLHFYFMQSNNAFNYLHPLIQKGAKNTINITNDRFLGNSIPFPKAKDEATYIANALTSIQTKIDIEKSLLRSYEKEKQYLLRQLFI